MGRILIEHIGVLSTPVGRSARGGKKQGEILQLKDAYIAAENGFITAVGAGEAPAQLREGAKILSAGGRLVTPGLIDSHTHLIFGGWRQSEMALKLRGVPYLEILRQGGGILKTVSDTRSMSAEALAEKARKVLDQMLAYGVTCCEAKSGYGLCVETEIRQMEALRILQKTEKIELVSTCMAAHALPKEYESDREGFLRLLEEDLFPRVQAEGLAEFCDVFCEEGVFSAEEARRILEAGKKAGLAPKIHADEIARIGGTQTAKITGAVSAEHLICCSEEGAEELREGGVIACLLPCTSLYLRASYAPARMLIEKNVPVAVATDFNPGSCPCSNLQLAMTTAALQYRMTAEEVLTAVTLNAAAALRRAERLGSLEVGKQADLVIWDAEDLDYIIYRMGTNLVSQVIKAGTVVS